MPRGLPYAADWKKLVSKGYQQFGQVYETDKYGARHSDQAMNIKKIVDMKIYSIADITETQGSIVTMTTIENETEAGIQHYVFRKINGGWKIYDID